MDLRDYGHALWSRRWLMMAIVVGCVAIAALYTLRAPTTYRASAQLFVATANVATDDAYQSGLFSQERVKSYEQMVNSPAVMARVIESLGLDQAPEDLARQISADAPLDTVLLNVNAEARSASTAQAIANETAQEFAEYVVEFEATNSTGEPLVEVTVIRPAALPTSPSSPRPIANLGLGVVAGLVLAVTAAIARDRLDPSLRSSDDVSRLLGVSALGLVPVRRHDIRYQVAALRSGHLPSPDPAYQVVRARLEVLVGDKLQQSVLVTSANDSEDTASIATALALDLASSEIDVVLVDADIHNHRLTSVMALTGQPGVVQVLRGQVTLDEVTVGVHQGASSVQVIPAGPLSNGVHRLDWRRVGGLIRDLESRGITVVVDAPPSSAQAGTTIVAATVETVIVVVQSGRTSRTKVRNALRTFAAAGAPVTGVLLAERVRRRHLRR